MRTLTGPRWRLGGRDIAALWRRAVELDDSGGLAQTATAEQIVSRVAPDADAACLADAVCDPGPAERYSAEGFRRITALGDELTGLRAHLSFPVADLVTEIRRVLGVDAEARAAQPASAGWTGTEHLDAFTDVVADYASRPGASVAGLLAYLDAAMDVENGLPPAELAVSQDRVQILTVHAAKGLEWQLVAVPHLSGRVFPSTGKARTWLTDPADLPPLLRGDRATTTDHGVPVLDTSDVNDRKTLSDRINDHKSRLEQRRIDEERRLLYVALTRAEDTLLLSGHHWGGTEAKPRGPSEFLCELKDIIDRADEEGRPCGVVDQWTPEPAAGEVNPLRDNLTEVMWPADPTGEHRPDIEVGALHVTRAMTDGPAEGDDVEGWAADVDALLAERDRVARRDPLTLPVQVSVSTLVRLRAEPDEVLHRLQRRLPAPPAPHASLGTAFHEWVQRFYGAERLFDLDDLPGAADGAQRRGEEEQLAELQAAFMVSPWAARTPLDVEVPFDMVIGDTMVRGRIDAVFADPDGGATVVDWKTGAPPTTQEAREQAAIQLAVYRLAWAALRGVPVERVRAAFHYVRSGQTVNPSALPEASELAALLEGVATEVA
jgi:DNA helicase-2/ATP-dependent DNA helicase PcrA